MMNQNERNLVDIHRREHVSIIDAGIVAVVVSHYLYNNLSRGGYVFIAVQVVFMEKK